MDVHIKELLQSLPYNRYAVPHETYGICVVQDNDDPMTTSRAIIYYKGQSYIVQVGTKKKYFRTVEGVRSIL